MLIKKIITKKNPGLNVFFIFFCAGAVSLLLRILIPTNAVFGSSHDDELFVQISNNLSQGNWLGEWANFDHRLFAKSPGYPIFLAVSQLLGISPILLIHFLLLFAAGACAYELRLRIKNFDLGAIVFFTAVAFNPVFFGLNMSRVYREGLLTALALMILSISLTISRKLISRKIKANLPIFIASALSFTLFYITKISWHFLLPILLLIPVLENIEFLRKNPSTLRVFGRQFVVYLLILVVTVIGTSNLITKKNKNLYEVDLIENFSQGNFANFLMEFSRIDNGKYLEFTLVDSNMRSIFYGINSKAEQLKPFLETNIGNNWSSIGCEVYGYCQSPESGAWFPWDLRDAIVESGLGSTPIAFEQTSKNFAKDIHEYCQRKSDNCLSKPIAPTVVPIERISIKRLINAEFLAANHIYNLTAAQPARFQNIEPNDKQKQIWQSVKGVKFYEGMTEYQLREISLNDAYSFQTNLFKLFWQLTLTFASLIFLKLLVFKRKELLKLIVPMLALMSASILIFQLALLHASTGEFMTNGGKLYLLPIYTYVTFFCVWITFNNEFIQRIFGTD